MLDSLERYKKYIPLLLRIGLASVFIIHGWIKVTGIDAIVGFFTNAGIPLPSITAWIVAIIEFVGGILVLVGFQTRIASALIGLVMIGAMIFVKFSQGFLGGWEFDWVLLVMAVCLMFSGGGALSIDGES
jgi:putative oxidoreductase